MATEELGGGSPQIRAQVCLRKLGHTNRALVFIGLGKRLILRRLQNGCKEPRVFKLLHLAAEPIDFHEGKRTAGQRLRQWLGRSHDRVGQKHDGKEE